MASSNQLLNNFKKFGQQLDALGNTELQSQFKNLTQQWESLFSTLEPETSQQLFNGE